MRNKPFLAPFWIMLGILLIACLQTFFLYKLFAASPSGLKSELFFFNFLVLPFVLLIEVVIYWIIRNKITERKWAWAHVSFTFLGFVVLRLLIVIVTVLVIDHSSTFLYTYRRLFFQLQFYGFWSFFVIGHIFFIILLVRSFTAKIILPEDDSFLDIPH